MRSSVVHAAVRGFTRSTTLLAVASLVAACGAEQSAPSTAPETTAGDVVPDTITAHWNRSCALCHVDGTGGAPRIGVAADWAPRLAAGEDVLLARTLEGFNNMPPLGYCMSCTEEDFRALIRFMTTPSRGRT